MTTDTTLPASDRRRFRKILFIKMRVTDQIKIIDNNIKSNQPQYDSGRLAVKISPYSRVN